MQPSNTPEEWRPVVGYEGIYEVSNHGQVRSVPRDVKYSDGRTRSYPSRVIRPATTSKGYKSLILSYEGVTETKRIHWLVLEAFVGPRPEGMLACHWDDDPANNHVDNLRWDTPSANQRDAIRNGRNHNAGKSHCNRGHEYTEANTIHQSKGPGKTGRVCRTCDRARSRRRTKARHAAQTGQGDA